MRIILEPHGDDAILSCYDFLRHSDMLITFSSSRGSAELCKELKIKHIDLSLPDLGKKYPYEVIPVMKSYQAYLPYVMDLLNTIDKVKIGVMKLEELNIEKAQVFCPLGLRHVDHVLTRRIAEIALRKCKFVYYSEFPYNTQEWAKPFLENTSRSRTPWKQGFSDFGLSEKIRLFDKYYPTEVEWVSGFKGLDKEYYY